MGKQKLIFSRFFLRLFYISFIVEIGEENEHKHVLRQANERYDRWEFTVGCQQGQGKVNAQDHELQQLDLCDVLLPPQRLLQLWLKGGEEVVRVHDDVNETVDDEQQSGMRCVQVFVVDPRRQHHAGMVVSVQERYLVVLLAQHKKNRVQQVHDFREEVQVRTEDQNVHLLATTQVHVLAAEAKVFAEVRREEYLEFAKEKRSKFQVS
jgi:hypothetical protein